MCDLQRMAGAAVKPSQDLLRKIRVRIPEKVLCFFLTQINALTTDRTSQYAAGPKSTIIDLKPDIRSQRANFLPATNTREENLSFA